MALIFSFKLSFWQSCRIITPNIIKAYRRQDFSIIPMDLQKTTNAFECLKIAENIRDQAIDIVSFVDHGPHPLILLKAMEFVFKNRRKRPQLVFHLYGDFTLFARKWLESSEVLKRYKCKFLVASDRQWLLVAQFIKNPQNKLFKVPFPVDKKHFFVDDDLRAKFRRKLRLKRGTPVFIYTGRLSSQKQILSLMEDFFRASRRVFPIRPLLLIAGKFDNLGVPFVGDYPLDYHYMFRFHRLLKKIDARGNLVKFLGQIPPQELVCYYNAADYFVALSTHNDEDYGMSPIEAMFCGLPSIVTDWGGFTSFKTEKNFCHSIPVNFHDGKIFIDHGKAISIYARAMREVGGISRHRVSGHYQQLFSIQGLTSTYENILTAPFVPFESFTRAFHVLKARFKLFPHAPFVDLRDGKKYSNTYKEIYAPYFKDIPQDIQIR